jgi:hypothetical protein
MKISTPFIVLVVLVYVGLRVRYALRLRAPGRLSPLIIGLWLLMAAGVATLLFWNPKNPGNPAQGPAAASPASGK